MDDSTFRLVIRRAFREGTVGKSVGEEYKGQHGVSRPELTSLSALGLSG